MYIHKYIYFVFPHPHVLEICQWSSVEELNPINTWHSCNNCKPKSAKRVHLTQVSHKLWIAMRIIVSGRNQKVKRVEYWDWLEPTVNLDSLVDTFCQTVGTYIDCYCFSFFLLLLLFMSFVMFLQIFLCKTERKKHMRTERVRGKKREIEVRWKNALFFVVDFCCLVELVTCVCSYRASVAQTTSL